jgi:hypothetical protein
MLVFSDQRQTENLKRMDTQQALSYLVSKLGVDMRKRLEELQKPYDFSTDFEQRDELEKQLSEIYKQNLLAFNQNLKEAITKQKIVVGDALGGVGQGKTRACFESIRILRKTEKNQNIRFFRFYWDAGNGLALEKGEPHNACIGLRLFSILLGVESFETYTKLCKVNCKELVNHFGIEDVLEFIGRQILQYVNDKNDRCNVLIICLDEYQKFYEVYSENWRKALHLLLQYMCCTTGYNTKLQRDRLCIIPIISGTLPTELKKFHLTDYTIVHFKFRPFTFATIEKIMKKLLGEELFSKATETNEAKRFWYEIGIIPRILIDYTIKDIILNKDCIINFDEEGLVALWDLVFDKVSLLQKFILNTTDIKTLFPLVISNVEIPKEDTKKANPFEFLEELELKGVIYWGRRDQIYLPFHYFRYVIRYCKPLLGEKLPKLSELFTWEYFESFEVQAFCSRIESFIQMKNEYVSLSDLFPGTFIPHIFSTDYQFKLPSSCIVQEDEEPFINNQNKVNAKIIKSELTEEQKLVHRTKAGCTAIDAFWITSFEYGKGQRSGSIMFCIQYSNCKDSNKQSYKDPPAWANSTYEKLKYVHELKNYEFVFILITNGKVPESKRPPLREASKSISNIEGQRRLIVISKECANEYFAPNLLPYYEYIDDLPDSDRISSSQTFIEDIGHTQQSMKAVDDFKGKRKNLKRKRKLDDMRYNELQKLAKKKGINTKQKKEVLVKELRQILNEE